MKLTPEERCDIVVGRRPEFHGKALVTFTHLPGCSKWVGGVCNCIVDLVLEYEGERYAIDALGNLTTVSEH